MGNSKFLDSLSKDGREALINKLLATQNHRCFICGEKIDRSLHTVNIDHIKPIVNGGKDDETNFAVTHESCNKSKQDADLAISRILFRLKKIMEKAEASREMPSLKHVLLDNEGSKYTFKYKIEDDQFIYSFDELGRVEIKKTEIITDELSGEQSVFIKMPIEYIYHDEIINPRGINNSISLLIKEFYKPNPQLHLSLARIDNGKIKIFDGQHKAVAQIMLGVRELTIRLFINPDLERLIETNTNAGSKLKQIAFDKSIVRQLHDTLYGERIKAYQQDHNMKEGDLSFSEEALVNYFKGERGNIKLYIINSQKNAIVKDPNNRLTSYINFGGREKALPLSYSSFEKTFLSTFINNKTILKSPINYKEEEGMNPRVLEKDQMIKLCNIIADNILVNKFDTDIGIHKIENKITEGKDTDISDEHLIAYRLFKEEILNGWVEWIKLVINNYFSNVGTMYDRENLFQQQFPDQLWTNITNFIINLRDLPVWKNRLMASTIFGGKNNYQFWVTIFNTGKAPDGTQVLAVPFNATEMIKLTK